MRQMAGICRSAANGYTGKLNIYHGVYEKN